MIVELFLLDARVFDWRHVGRAQRGTFEALGGRLVFHPNTRLRFTQRNAVQQEF